jgi:predicted nucleic acid-binding protein
MFLLDTCVVSEGMRQVPDPDVDIWLRKQRNDELFISAMTAGELLFGIETLPTGRRRRVLESWYAATVSVGFDGRILPFDFVASEFWARLRSRHNVANTVDSQIAATALAHEFVVVTRNVRDFAYEGLKVLNPWRK